MAEISAGEVTVPVLPDTREFAKKLRTQLEAVAKKIGLQVGEKLGEGLGDTAPKTGEKVGKRFADSFKATVGTAIKNLPDASINLEDTKAQAKLEELRARLTTLSTAKVGVDLDAGKALAEIKLIEAELKSLGARSPKIDVKIDLAKATAELAAIRAEADKVSGNNGGGIGGLIARLRTASGKGPGGFGGLMTAGLALGPALIPMLAVLAAGVLSILAPLSAGVVGFGLFAAIAVPAIKNAVTNVAALHKAEQDLADAKTPEEHAKALLAIDAAQQKVTTGQIAFVGTLDSVKSAWKGLSDKFADASLSIAGTVLAALPGFITRLTPLINALIPVFGMFAAQLNMALSGPGSQHFIDFLIANAPQALENLFKVGLSLGTIFGHVIEAVAPLGQGVLKTIADGLAGMAKSSGDLSSNQGFQNFLAYAKEEAPKVGEFIKDAAKALGDIFKAIKPLSGISLGALDLLAKLIDKIPPPLLGAIAGGIILVSLATKALGIAMLILDANPIMLIVIAVAILLAAVILNFGAIKDFIVRIWNDVSGLLFTWGPVALLAIAPFIAIPILIWQHFSQITGWLSGIWADVKNGVTDAKDWIVSKWNSVFDFFSGIPGRMAGMFSGMWDGIKNAFRDALNWVIDHWNGLHFEVPVDIFGHTKGIGVPHVDRFAFGGPVFGRGNGLSDSIPAMLSHGEFVVNAAATRANFGLLSAINAGRKVQGPPAGNTFNTTINQVDDPMGTAVAVARRQAALVS